MKTKYTDELLKRVNNMVANYGVTLKEVSSLLKLSYTELSKKIAAWRRRNGAATGKRALAKRQPHIRRLLNIAEDEVEARKGANAASEARRGEDHGQ